MIRKGLILLCPITSPQYGAILGFDGGAEAMILGGLVLLCPLPRS